MKKIVYFSMFTMLFIGSCQKNACCKGEKAIFKDLHGLDGCGYVIELDNGKRLEPVNMKDFSITPENGKKIWVKYHKTSGGSVCMVGEIVKIDCISEY